MKAELRGFFAGVFILAASHAAFAGNVTAVTSKQFYEIGELVEFTFMNGLDEFIEEYNTHKTPSQDIADEVLKIAQDWLIDHIADVDMVYATHVKSGS